MASRGALLLCLSATLITSTVFAGTGNQITGQQLRIGTFNIRWFGSPEHDASYEPRSKTVERVAAVKDFLAKEVLPLDVIAFQEIVDLRALKAALPKGWKCESYEHNFADHQHVAICVSASFSLRHVPYDDNNTIEELAYYNAERARPAVRLDVVNKAGASLVRVVAVHLKSAPNFAKLRLKQAGFIGRDLRNDANIPMIVMGDFNSFPKKQTGLEADDTQLIEAQLNQSGGGFKHVVHKTSSTYRKGSQRGLFDHFYVNALVKKTTVPKVFGVCSSKENGKSYMNADHYLQYVSDHCPVSMTVHL